VNSTLPQSALILTPKVHGADGVSALTRLVAGSLTASRVDTRVLTLEEETRTDLADGPLSVPVESADGGRLRFLLNGLKNAPRARRPELVIATHLGMLPAAVPLMARGVPVMTFLLGVECWRPLSRRHRSLLARCDRLLPISEWTWNRFVDANPAFAAAPMTLCPPGIASAALPATKPIPCRALVVGRLWAEERYKGHDLLVEVWPMVVRACPKAHLVVVGDGDDRPRLEARVRNAGLSDHIKFTGLVSQNELRQQFAEAQLFALPSDGEGFGIVFLEAMRAARPCVAASGAASEIVRDGITGRVITPRDASVLTAILIELLNDPHRCEAMGKAGRRRFEEEYSLTRFSERLMTALEHAGATC
jgi:glycosyltransferase involved in cell wall biosynthesis